MKAQAFAQWLAEYVAFRTRASEILSKSVPGEQGQLMFESQELEPLRWEAESYRAASHAFYYRSKAFKRMEAIAKSRPASTIEGEIKAASHQELWAREDSEGICRVITSRVFAIDRHLKLIGKP